MWIMLNDAFLSIVSKDCPRDSLLVRARRKGDIEKIFPKAAVKRSTTTDYLYRAVVSRAEVESAMRGEIGRITYSNFKDSVQDKPLHDAYLRVWNSMANLQLPRPFTVLNSEHWTTQPTQEEAHMFATGHMPDEQIDTSDIPEAGENWFRNATVKRMKPGKKNARKRSLKKGR